MKRLPHGESVLPYLAAVLFVLLFVAWPLVDVGLLVRPLLGVTFLLISLTGLYILGAPGRFAPVLLTLGGIVFVSQMTMLAWPSDTAALVNEVADELFLLVLCGVLLTRVMGPGRITLNRWCSRGLSSIRGSIRVSVRPGRAVVIRRFCNGK